MCKCDSLLVTHCKIFTTMVLNFKWSKMQKSLQMSQVKRTRIMILNFLDTNLSKLRHINNNLLVLKYFTKYFDQRRCKPNMDAQS